MAQTIFSSSLFSPSFPHRHLPNLNLRTSSLTYSLSSPIHRTTTSIAAANVSVAPNAVTSVQSIPQVGQFIIDQFFSTLSKFWLCCSFFYWFFLVICSLLNRWLMALIWRKLRLNHVFTYCWMKLVRLWLALFLCFWELKEKLLKK